MMLEVKHKDNSTTEDAVIFGELDKYYYNNRDLHLLLDLLANTSGVETSLCVLALFDNTLGEKCKPGDLKFTKPYYHERETETNIANEDGVTERIDKTKVYDIGLMFADCPAMNELFSLMKNVICIYTVEVLPPTASFSVEPVKVI